MANALAQSSSPYLQQHADNPVDWVEWGPAAFSDARERDIPVLLSVGYAACHWCHVMAHESFEDETVAAQMNQQFVCVKVDREERPDVDAIYMEATQALTGQGGWPMTVFLTPDAEPVYAGTYFPPTPSRGMPAFTQVLTAISEAWHQRRDEIVASGAQITEHLRAPRSLGDPIPLGDNVLDATVESLHASFDATDGGFGSAPKFPPSMVLEFLLRHSARTSAVGERTTALDMAEATCEAMARGGMYDQLGGGFARYSVDGRWVVPHFEKMLYDNALLLPVYLHLWRETGSALGRRVADETASFLLRDLRTAQGGFASALDADTDGVEGLTYAWTPGQLTDVLGADDGAWAARVFGVTESGTFEHDSSVLQLRADPEDLPRWARTRDRLLAARVLRPQPARDDKVVTAWNGLAIDALAEHYLLTGSEPSLHAAVEAAELILGLHLVDGRLRRVSRDGLVGKHSGVLEDYACLSAGLLRLHEATGAGRWLAVAGELLEVVLTRFDDGAGGFFDTPDDGEALLRRPQDPTDGPTPSGTAAACAALIAHAALTGRPEHRDRAEAVLARFGTVLTRAPRAAGAAAACAEALLTGPLEIVVAGAPGPERDMLAEVARAATSPGAVRLVGEPDIEGAPLLADRRVSGRPVAAFVCRDFSCQAPTSDPAELGRAIRVGVR